jgi:hypothetical protein
VRKEREALPVPHTENESKDSKWQSPTPSFILERLGKIHMVKDNGSGLLRWLTKQGVVNLPNHIQSHLHPSQVTETIGVPFIALYTSKDPGNLLTSQRGKQKQVTPVCLPAPVTLASKR